ncbi:MAG: AraC family transcriptional regulator [Thermoleophilia bacterium]|nr:AraC family transcriptional regulator [Thermoleophilia bacterium]
MNTARAEYVARIDRVMDHIERHLDARLSLDELAAVAGFSPFHFHRIFAAMVGETLSQFIRRLRLERAAARLVTSPTTPVTAVALECGFSGSAAFARAFREAFGMTASEWRRAKASPQGSGEPVTAQDRKNGQLQSKLRQEFAVEVPYGVGARHRLTWRVTRMDDHEFGGQVEVREEPEFTLAYVRHTGPYAGDGELFARLFATVAQWAGPRGLLGPATKAISVYHDSPSLTEPDKLRISVGFSVPADTPVGGEIGKMTIAGGTYAVAHFELADDEYGRAWDAVFCGWLPESGYQPADGLCFEWYHGSPEEHPQGKTVVDICVPVKPL